MTRHRLITICALTLVILSTRFAFAEETVDAFTPPEGLRDGWYARIETSKGRIIAQLLPGQAPQAVAYFAAMAEGRLEWFDRNSGELKKGHYYDGIEVQNYDRLNMYSSEEANRIASWYDAWDCSSGCVWNLECVVGAHSSAG